MGCQQSKEEPAVGRAVGERRQLGKTERLISKTRRALIEDLSVEETPQTDASGQLVTAEIVKRTETSVFTLSTVCGNGNEATSIDYSWWTQRGYYPDNVSKANQDRLYVNTNFCSDPNDAMFAVFDGHGDYGHDCADFVKLHLPIVLSKYIKKMRASLFKPKPGQPAFSPKLWPHLNIKQYNECCQKAYRDVQQSLAQSDVQARFSGTTALTVHFHNDFVTICNVGDSRAILGHVVLPNDLEETKEEIGFETTTSSERTIAIPLSHDHTPYRKDERQRILQSGGVIRTLDQHKGLLEEDKKPEDEWDAVMLGQTVDLQGDPPRVWVASQDYPGCAFTRSIGDTMARDIGVIAEPEILTLRLNCRDKYLVIASDGIFEFLTNQAVIDICEASPTPIVACENLVKAAYDKWLIYEDRTDDITVIVLFLDNGNSPAPGTTEDLINATSNRSVTTTTTTTTSSSADSLYNSEPNTPTRSQNVYSPGSGNSNNTTIVVLNDVSDSLQRQ